MFSQISVEFDNNIMKIAEGIKKGNSLSVLRCIFVELPRNCIEDGKIKNVGIVLKLFENALKDNKIKTRKAFFILNTNAVISRKIDLPFLNSKKDTKSMIDYNIEEIFSHNSNQYIFTYKISDVFMREGVKYASYIIQGLPIEIYNQYIELSKSMKLVLKNLDISTNSLENLAANYIDINQNQFSSEFTNAFVKINKDSLSFNVLNKGINEFFRIYYLSENENKNNELVAEDYEFYSVEYSNYNEHNNTSNLIKTYSDIILKYLKYYYSINKGKQEISKIYVYGEYCSSETAKDLKYSLDMNVEFIQTISNVMLDNVSSSFISDFNVSNYLNCILSLLDKRKKSNFLSEKQKYHKIKFNAALATMSVLIILSLSFAFKGINYLYKSSIEKNEFDGMLRFIENKYNIKQNNEIEESKKQIEKLKKYLEFTALTSDKIKSEDFINSDLLSEINASVPEKTSIFSVSMDKNNIHLMCKSNELKEISIFLNNLRNTEFISNIHVPEVEIKNDGNEVFYSYQILCNRLVK